MHHPEGLGHLDELLEDFQRQGAFRPPQRRAATPLRAPNVPVAVAVPPVAVGATPRAETQRLGGTMVGGNEKDVVPGPHNLHFLRVISYNS